MLQFRSFKLALLLGSCALLGASMAFAQTVNFVVPGGELKAALDTYVRQAGIQLVYREDDVRGVRTEGVKGAWSKDEALERILRGTEFVARVDASGAVAVVRSRGPAAAAVYGGEETAARLARVDETMPDGQASGQSAAGQRSIADSEGGSQDVQLEEIVVTAQKRMERLQDVPVPVTAISGESLINSNQLRVQDYYTKVPGLSLTLAGNGNEPVVSIRGITAGAESNPNVGIVVDEVSYGASVATGGALAYAPDIDPGDLARVEVLRGPQGTLYGAASMGGLLKFVTVDPSTDRLSGRLQVGSSGVSHSDDVGYSLRGSVNMPVNDTFAVRLSGFTISDPGYIDNVETGRRDVNSRNSDGGRLSALWRPSDAFSLKLSALFQDSQRDGMDDIDTLRGKDDPKQAFLTGTGMCERQTEAYSATMVGKIGRVELVSATGYSNDDAFDKIDNTLSFGGFLVFVGSGLYGVDLDRTWTSIDTHVKKFTQEVRASLPIGKRVNWMLGAFYTDEDTLFVNDVIATDSRAETSNPLLTNINDPAKFEELAAFTNVTVALTDRWDIQLGGRISEYEQDYQATTVGPLFSFSQQPNPPPQRFRSDGDAFTYLVTPRFKVSEDLMAYARLASGYRPGGANPTCLNDATIPCNFDADTTENYDLGIKGDVYDGRLSFDAALYYIDWQDMQVAGIVSPTGFGYTSNVGKAKSQGVELSLELKPLRGLTLSGWAAYNDAQLTADFPPGEVFGRSGDRLPYSSRFSGEVSVNQEFALWNEATGFVGGSVTYVDDRIGKFQRIDFLTGLEIERQTFASYTQLDLSGGVRYDTWTVHVFINNVTDKRGELRGGTDAGAPEGAIYFAYTQPRTYGLSLSKTF